MDWYSPKTWTVERVATDVVATLKPLLKGYTLTRSTDDDDRIILNFEGPNRTWVQVLTHNVPEDDPGFQIAVGHNLDKSVHTVQIPPFTAAQGSAVTIALTSYLKLGLADAENNFASLRGTMIQNPKLFKANHEEAYNCSVSFVPGLPGCRIVDGQYYEFWRLEGTTIALGGTPEQARAYVHALVTSALPYGYTAEIDPVGNDYAWDGPFSISVQVRSEVKDGKTAFNITILHHLR